MSRAWVFLWIVLFCEGLIYIHGTQTQTDKNKETSRVLKKRGWWWGCSGSKPGGHAWNNNWDGRLFFQCPPAHSISSVYSIFRACRKDRLFEFKCKYTFAGGYYGNHCHWSGYVNSFDQPINFRCPNGQFLAGVDSYHQNHQEDRRFKFKCCGHPSGYHVSSCYKTSYVNNWRQTLNFKVQDFHYLVGAYSYHLNSQEDRRWRFEVCKIPDEP
ncbi:hemagglutinin/amebocyte aggregation factor-like [Oculina patagonica]